MCPRVRLSSSSGSERSETVLISPRNMRIGHQVGSLPLRATLAKSIYIVFATRRIFRFLPHKTRIHLLRAPSSLHQPSLFLFFHAILPLFAPSLLPSLHSILVPSVLLFSVLHFLSPRLDSWIPFVRVVYVCARVGARLSPASCSRVYGRARVRVCVHVRMYVRVPPRARSYVAASEGLTAANRRGRTEEVSFEVVSFPRSETAV